VESKRQDRVTKYAKCTIFGVRLRNYLHQASVHFLQTSVASASPDKDDLVRFWGQKVKGHDRQAEFGAVHQVLTI